MRGRGGWRFSMVESGGLCVGEITGEHKKPTLCVGS